MLGQIGLDGVMEAEPVGILLDSASGVRAISKDSVKEFQMRASGWMQVTRLFT